MSSTSYQYRDIPGLLFAPRDQELLMAYLRKRILGEPLPCDAIIERDLYAENANPWELFTEDDPWNVIVAGDDHDSIRGGKKTIYVLTKLSKVGRQGNKNFSRTAGCGKWHGQTGPKDIMGENPKSKIGIKRMFTFKSSRKDSDGKGHWIMYEYSLSDDGLIGINGSPEYVVCKIIKDESKNFKKEQADCRVLGKRKLRDQDDYKTLIGVDDQQQWRSITNGGNYLVLPEADSSSMVINSPTERVQNKTGHDDNDVMRRFASYSEDSVLANSPSGFDSSAKPGDDHHAENVGFTLTDQLNSLADIYNSLPEFEQMNDKEVSEYLNAITFDDIPVADDTSNFMSERFTGCNPPPQLDKIFSHDEIRKS